MTMLAVALPATTASSINRRRATQVRPIANGQPSSTPHRPLPKEAVNAPRQQTASAEIPIASDAQLRHLPRFPCMGLFLSRGSPEPQIFCPSSVSLFDLKARFFVPTRV